MAVELGLEALKGVRLNGGGGGRVAELAPCRHGESGVPRVAGMARVGGLGGVRRVGRLDMDITLLAAAARLVFENGLQNGRVRVDWDFRLHEVDALDACEQLEQF